jgi:hypothetical protein
MLLEGLEHFITSAVAMALRIGAALAIYNCDLQQGYKSVD